MENQVKSKQRVANHGEVFTAEREVKAMCDLVNQETERIDSRFLEPACGDGNFLAEILTRKLAVVSKKYIKSSFDWERYSLLALGSIYGIDILSDNAETCRKRLFGIWKKEYEKACKNDCNEDTEKSAMVILNHNVVCGNALTLMQVNEQQQDTNRPIIFSEWTFPFNDAKMHRKDYTMAELLNTSEENSRIEETGQLSLLGNDTGEIEPTLLREFITHYRRLSENG